MAFGKKKEYDDSNRIALWDNEKMREGVKDPDLKGSAKVECPCCGEKSDYWLSVWQQAADGRRPVLTGRLTAKDENREPSSSNGRERTYGREKRAPKTRVDDDDIPF